MYQVIVFTLFFFFKQKTAYEITYGDWSSDVCSSDLVDYHKDAAQGCFAFGGLWFLGRHLGHKAAHRGSLFHADDRIVVAAHPGIADISGAAGQDLMIGGRHMRMGAQHGRDASIGDMAERHLLARRL